MKKLNFYIVILLTLFLTSCEEVIDLKLDTAPAKLVIEAAIKWEKGTMGNMQIIKLTTTTDYFNDVIPVVSGAKVFIKNEAGTIFNFFEDKGTGRYLCNTFIPMFDQKYTLVVNLNNETYTATETLHQVVPIKRIEQNDEGGILGDKIEIRAFFDDPALEANYYLFKYSYSNKVNSTIYVSEDKFYDGNEFYSSSDDDDLKSGDTIQLSHGGISQRYYNYMNILVSVAGSGGGGGPFQSPPATVRGNIINTTNPANYPLGFFSLSETDSLDYIIK